MAKIKNLIISSSIVLKGTIYVWHWVIDLPKTEAGPQSQVK